MKLVSIIVPYYNNNYEDLKRLLASIKNQVGFDLNKIEIIFSDDASPKETVDFEHLADEFEGLDIKYIKLEKNSGAGVARQTAIDMSDGEYIMFIDADDYLDGNMGFKSFENRIITDKEKYDIYTSSIYDEKLERFFNFDNGNSYLFGIFIKKDYLKKNNIRFNDILRIEEDSHFEKLLRYYKPKTKDIGWVNYHYSYNKDSVTNTNEREYLKKHIFHFGNCINTLLMCIIYEKNGEYDKIQEQLQKCIKDCYIALYNKLYVENNVDENARKLIHLLNVINEIYPVDFSKITNLKQNYTIYHLDGRNTNIDLSMFYDFTMRILEEEDIDEEYIIPGTNIKMNELKDYINEKRNIKEILMSKSAQL